MVDGQKFSEWALGHVLQADTDVCIAGDLIEGLRWMGGELKAASGGLWQYSTALGVWEFIDPEEIKSLVQYYDGGYRHSPTGKGQLRINVSAMKMAGVASCVVRTKELQDQKFFDNPRTGLAFENGFVTVTKDKVAIAGHSKENAATFAHDGEFVETAQCPKFLRFLVDVFDGAPDTQQRIDALQEFIGACLTRTATNYQKVLALLGAGSNGKSVLIDVIRSLFQPDSITTISPHDMAKSPYLMATLSGKALNIAPEVSAKEVADTSTFKQVVTGDECQARHPYGRPFMFKPRAGHIMSLNDTFYSTDLTLGFWRRFLILPMERDFSNDPKRADPKELTESLIREKMGIIAWGLRGAVRLLNQGKYTIPGGHLAAIDEWRESIDSAAAFKAACLRVDSDHWTDASLIYESYEKYVGKAKLRNPLGPKNFYRRLRQILGIMRPKKSSSMQYPVDILPEIEWFIN